jgi:hypothetical protein
MFHQDRTIGHLIAVDQGPCLPPSAPTVVVEHQYVRFVGDPATGLEGAVDELRVVARTEGRALTEAGVEEADLVE